MLFTLSNHSLGKYEVPNYILAGVAALVYASLILIFRDNMLIVMVLILIDFVFMGTLLDNCSSKKSINDFPVVMEKRDIKNDTHKSSQ